MLIMEVNMTQVQRVCECMRVLVGVGRCMRACLCAYVKGMVTVVSFRIGLKRDLGDRGQTHLQSYEISTHKANIL